MEAKDIIWIAVDIDHICRLPFPTVVVVFSLWVERRSLGTPMSNRSQTYALKAYFQYVAIHRTATPRRSVLGSLHAMFLSEDNWFA